VTDLDRRIFPGEEKDSATGARSRSTAGESDNIVDLLRDLVNQGTHLADQQLTLIKAEVRESASDVKAVASGFVSAAVVGIAGLGVLLMGLAYLLADAIDNLGLATIIVGAVALLLALILYRSAAGKMNATTMTPDRTERTLQRTPDAVRGEL
jgi:hypothetical protein